MGGRWHQSSADDYNINIYPHSLTWDFSVSLNEIYENVYTKWLWAGLCDSSLWEGVTRCQFWAEDLSNITHFSCIFTSSYTQSDSRKECMKSSSARTVKCWSQAQWNVPSRVASRPEPTCRTTVRVYKPWRFEDCLLQKKKLNTTVRIWPLRVPLQGHCSKMQCSSVSSFSINEIQRSFT